MPGRWPQPERRRRGARWPPSLDGLADGTEVVVDGLIASAAPEVLVPRAAPAAPRRARAHAARRGAARDPGAATRRLASARCCARPQRVVVTSPLDPRPAARASYGVAAEVARRRARRRRAPVAVASPARRLLCVAAGERAQGPRRAGRRARRRSPTSSGAAPSSAASTRDPASCDDLGCGCGRCRPRATASASPACARATPSTTVLRRGRPARAPVARRDVRHGRHRGARARDPGGRNRRRRRPDADGRRPDGDAPRPARAARRRRGAGAALRTWLTDADLRDVLRGRALRRRESLDRLATHTARDRGRGRCEAAR